MRVTTLIVLAALAACVSTKAVELHAAEGANFLVQLPKGFALQPASGSTDAALAAILDSAGTPIIRTEASNHPVFGDGAPSSADRRREEARSATIREIAWETDGRQNRDVEFDWGKPCAFPVKVVFSYRSLSGARARVADDIIASVVRGRCLTEADVLNQLRRGSQPPTRPPSESAAGE